MPQCILHLENDNLVAVVAQNASTGAYPSDATVRITALTCDDASVSGSHLALPVTCDYQAGSNGEYHGVLDLRASSAVVNRKGVMTVEITSGSLNAQLSVPVVYRTREGNSL